MHLGVSEFYIKKGAKVTFTMIHSWNPEFAVRPRTAAIIEEDGLFLSNYVLMKPVNTIQMNPIARCNGRGATARFNSVLVARRVQIWMSVPGCFSMPEELKQKS